MSVAAPTPNAETRIAEILSDTRSKDFRRDLPIELAREAINEADRTVEFSFAGSTPVERWFGYEELDITTSACDLTRLNSGAACLMDHNWSDQVGVVEKAWIDTATNKARCRVKFSRVGRGKEIFEDVKDGIRRLVSVGYIVRKMVLKSVEGDVETHRVTEWEPFEVSFVAVPADPSVGVGRSAKPNTEAPGLETQNSKPPTPNSSPSRTMSAPATPAAPAAPAVSNIIDFSAERQRVKDINAAARTLAGRHAQHLDAINTLARTCAEDGATVENFSARVLNEVLATAPAAPASNVRQINPELGLSKKEQRSYSILKAIREVTSGKGLSGLEKEACEAEGARLGRDAGGFFVPAEVFTFAKRHFAEQRALSAGTASAGGYLIGETIDTANMVALLRNQSHVINLGARVLGGLVGNVSIPRHITGATVYWVSENGTITDSSAAFGQIQLKPRRMGATTQLGKQLIAQDSIDVEMFARDDINAAIGIELDRVAINGNGASEPLGVLNLATGDRSTSVTFGAAPTWAKVVSFETNVETANALGLAGGAYAYLTSPGVKGSWKTTPRISGAAAGFLWEKDEVNGYAARSTNQVPSNKVIFGQFGQVIIGEWAGTDVVVDNVTLATTHQIKLTIQKLVDVTIRQGKAFAISTDAGNQ